jgi:CelD/BcsL family acetyltransferase involved in cellulose biosynthesis
MTTSPVLAAPAIGFPLVAARHTAEAVDPARWDALVRTFPGHTIFHELAWLAALAATHHLCPVLLSVERDGERVGVWPWLTRRKGPFRVAGSPLPGLGTPYIGPLFRADADVSTVLEAFLGHDALRRSSYLACRVIDRSRSLDLGRFGFSRQKTFETSWLDLHEPEGALWRNLKSECRTRIRRAEKLGIEIRREESPQFIDEFWDMTLETFTRSGSQPTHTRAFVEKAWELLHGAGRVLVLSAFHEGDRVGTLMLPFDDHTLYYWAGASFDRHRHLPAGNLLHWHAILEAKRLGLGGYDMISANGGPGRFKRSFGARVIHGATHWESYSSRFVALAKRAYELCLRRSRGIAPATGTESTP